MMYLNESKKLLINEILKIGLSKPFSKVRINDCRTFPVRSFSMSIVGDGIPVYSKGVYVIYASDDNRGRECLYVGESNWCINQRVRRFFKELTNCSHPDEEHAGARRARNGGYTSDSHSYYVKYVSMVDISDIMIGLKVYPDLYDIDEHIACYLKSKYNSTTYPMYGYDGCTLKEFMEMA